VKSLRQTLITSRVSAIAVAILLFFFFDFLVRALLGPLSDSIMFLVTAIAIRGVPYIPKRLGLYDQIQLVGTAFILFEAAASLAAAWLLSRWVYGVGAFACLKRSYPQLTRRDHV